MFLQLFPLMKRKIYNYGNSEFKFVFLLVNKDERILCRLMVKHASFT